jgi:hypothetical protein
LPHEPDDGFVAAAEFVGRVVEASSIARWCAIAISPRCGGK